MTNTTVDLAALLAGKQSQAPEHATEAHTEVHAHAHVAPVSESEAIAATNPTATLVAEDANLASKEFKLNFRKDSLGNKRDSITLSLPVPSVQGLVSIIEAGGNQLQLLLDIAADVVYQEARSFIDDAEFTPEKILWEKLSWQAIANQPVAQRKGSGIAKEQWEAFAQDYLATMPAVTGKSTEQLANACKLLVAKFIPCKTQKKIITFLRDQLNIWFTNTPAAEDFVDVYEFLSNKAEALLSVDEASLLDNL